MPSLGAVKATLSPCKPQSNMAGWNRSGVSNSENDGFRAVTVEYPAEYPALRNMLVKLLKASSKPKPTSSLMT